MLVRMHAMDPMLDIVGVGPRGRADEFGAAMKMVAEEGRGVVVLLRDTAMKIESNDNTSPSTLRQYGIRCANFIIPRAVKIRVTDKLTYP